MSCPTSSTPPSPVEDAVSAAVRLDRVLSALQAAQAELDALGQGLAAVQLDAAIETLKLAQLSSR